MNKASKRENHSPSKAHRTALAFGLDLPHRIDR